MPNISPPGQPCQTTVAQTASSQGFSTQPPILQCTMEVAILISAIITTMKLTITIFMITITTTLTRDREAACLLKPIRLQPLK